MATIDWQGVLGAGGITGALVGIAFPVWRKWWASQNLGVVEAKGATTWIASQAKELSESKALVTELLKLREADARVISALKLRDAMALEKMERILKHMRRLEDALIELKPEFANWIRADFIDLPAALDQLEGPTP